MRCHANQPTRGLPGAPICFGATLLLLAVESQWWRVCQNILWVLWPDKAGHREFLMAKCLKLAELHPQSCQERRAVPARILAFEAAREEAGFWPTSAVCDEGDHHECGGRWFVLNLSSARSQTHFEQAKMPKDYMRVGVLGLSTRKVAILDEPNSGRHLCTNQESQGPSFGWINMEKPRTLCCAILRVNLYIRVCTHFFAKKGMLVNLLEGVAITVLGLAGLGELSSFLHNLSIVNDRPFWFK